LNQIIRRRWFPIFDLACVSISIAAWEVAPRLGAAVLPLALLPWILRLAGGSFPFRRTRFDLPIGLFLLMTGIGVWTSFQPADAAAKAFLILGAVLLYYAVAGQPQENDLLLVGLFCLAGIGMLAYFLTTNDWGLNPSKLAFLNQAGLALARFRPAFLQASRSDTAAGVVAFSLPFFGFTAVFASQSIQKKGSLTAVYVALGLLVLLAVLAISASLSVVLAVAAGLLILVIRATRRTFLYRLPGHPRTVFRALVLLAFLVTAGVVLSEALVSAPKTMSMPVLDSVGSRLDLAYSAIKLVGDTPFTGSGLDTFSGLYAGYIRNTPYFLAMNSHNVYLDLAVELGLPGLALFLWVTLGALWQALGWIHQKTNPWLQSAVLSAFVISIFNSFAYNVIFTHHGAPLLFLFPGLVCALTRPVKETAPVSSTAVRPHLGKWPRILRKVRPVLWGAAGSVALIAGGVFLGPPLRSAWDANQGAVAMAKVDLAHFPQGTWTYAEDMTPYHAAETLFQQALAADPANRTANHRLGLLALKRGDFAGAAAYLQRADQADPAHRGIIKALGFSNLWAGNEDAGLFQLAPIPEAYQELGVYVSWWQNHQQPELARRAQAAYDLLTEVKNP
jgi:O-antigen ligase